MPHAKQVFTALTVVWLLCAVWFAILPTDADQHKPFAFHVESASLGCAASSQQAAEYNAIGADLCNFQIPWLWLELAPVPRQQSVHCRLWQNTLLNTLFYTLITFQYYQSQLPV